MQVSYFMTLILFTVFAGKTCIAVSLLPQDFNANFSGDPFTGDTPHDMFMRQVLHRNSASCGTVHNSTAQRAAGVTDLKLPALPAEPIFKRFHKENDDKRGKKYAFGT